MLYGINERGTEVVEIESSKKLNYAYTVIIFDFENAISYSGNGEGKKRRERKNQRDDIIAGI
jgi:hypothetical protein